MRHTCGDCGLKPQSKLDGDCEMEHGTCYKCWIGTVWHKLAQSLV